MDTLTSLRTLLLSSISEAKVTARNILILTKTSSITESLIIDEVSELLNIIIGALPTNFPHKGAQSDKQILETLTKLTKQVDKLSKQVNEPKCYKLHSAISPSILQQFSQSQWLQKALEKTF